MAAEPTTCIIGHFCPKLAYIPIYINYSGLRKVDYQRNTKVTGPAVLAAGAPSAESETEPERDRELPS